MTDDELKGLFQALRQDNAEMREDFGALRQDNAEMRKDFAALRTDFGALREDFGALREDNAELRNDFAALRTDFGALREDNAELRKDFGVLRNDFGELRQQNAAAHEETRRHFDVAVEAFKHEVKLVAESVAQTREALIRETTNIREEARRVASETQAMIRFSHAELDRRMRSLEEIVADLQTRVERLEASTH